MEFLAQNLPAFWGWEGGETWHMDSTGWRNLQAFLMVSFCVTKFTVEREKSNKDGELVVGPDRISKPGHHSSACHHVSMPIKALKWWIPRATLLLALLKRGGLTKASHTNDCLPYIDCCFNFSLDTQLHTRCCMFNFLNISLIHYV